MEKNEIKENTLVIPIAISGTGKTTLGKMLKEKYEDMKVISLDEIKEEIYDENISSKKRMLKAYEIFFDRITSEISNGNRVYADATNLQSISRKKLYAIARKYNSKVKILFFDVDKETSKQGNNNRSMHVPEKIIDKQYKDLKKARRWIKTEVPKGDIIDIVHLQKDISLEENSGEER